MDLLMIVLLLMVGLLVSNIVSHLIPAIPAALTQIAFGIIITLVSGNYAFEIDAEWFLILFVAPILYNDGRHFPQKELWGMKTQILGNAFFLVILTTIGCGFVIHYLIPSIPLAAAFALGAILSPTDPVAVTGIAKRVKIPEKVMILVKGESLINDATGLVAFKFAIAAVVTGYFSLSEAALDFSYVFFAGACSGLLLGVIVTSIRFQLRKIGIHDVVFHSLLQIAAPFAIYISTEHVIHASGVIAVVIAGIVHSTVKQYTETLVPEEQLLTENTWSMLLFVLNGFVFLLLGMNIPSSMVDILSHSEIAGWVAFGYVFAITITLLVIRFVWSSFTTLSTHKTDSKHRHERASFTLDLITTLTGVRGAVTMAGVLTIPVSLADGTAFPECSFIIFLAAGVILLLLILASVFLPILCKDEAEGSNSEDASEFGEAKLKLLLIAIRNIKKEMKPENKAAAAELMQEYTMNFQQNLTGQNYHDKYIITYNQQINKVSYLAIKIQRDYIAKLLAAEKIDRLVHDQLVQFLDMQESALANGLRKGAKIAFNRIKHVLILLVRRIKQMDFFDTDRWMEIKHVQIQAMETVIHELGIYADTIEHPEYVYTMIVNYENILLKYKHPDNHYHTDNFHQEKKALRLKVIDAERNAIRAMYETGEINGKQEKNLRKDSNFLEGILLFEHIE